MIDVVGISLGSKKRMYYFSPNGLDLRKDDKVVVETEKGKQYGTVVQTVTQIGKEKALGGLKRVLWFANDDDIKQFDKNVEDARTALIKCRELVQKHKLNMVVITAEFTLEREQLMFRFLADERVDFRSLAKDLASIYRTRIELYQIGVRDKAKEVSGLGPCGQQLCCSRFKSDFDAVSINMAKNQNIALNPTKINGQCGRLLCCLKYEDDCYRECRKDLPNIGNKYVTDKGEGRVISIDILAKKFRVFVPDNGIIEIEK